MITSQLVDMDDFTLAYGLILLVQGIGSLIGPPLAGAIFQLTNRWVLALLVLLLLLSGHKIYDLTLFIAFLSLSPLGRWDDSFYAGGICVALSGLCAYVIGELRVESDEDENNNDEDEPKNNNNQLKWDRRKILIEGRKKC